MEGGNKMLSDFGFGLLSRKEKEHWLQLLLVFAERIQCYSRLKARIIFLISFL